MDDLKLYQIFLIFRWNSGGIMPKKRKQPGTRNFEKRIFILCEGSDKHSEYAYFTSLLRDYPMKGNRVQISLVPTEKNTGKELVLEAAEKLKSEYKNWVVYDQDGYTKHAETFCIAKDNARKLRKDKEKTDFGKSVYELNPYTDVDVLISEIQEESQK